MDAAKTLATIDELANNIANLYIAQSNAVIGLLNASLLLETNSTTVKKFEISAVKSAKSFAELINKFIDAGVTEILSTVDNKGIIGTYLRNSSKHVKQSITRQMLEDIALVKIDLFRFVMMVRNEQVSKSKTNLSASIAARKSVKFVHVDRMGRRKSAQLYIASVVKMWAVSAIFDGYFAKAVESGSTTITLSNDDKVSVFDCFENARYKYCHPNTKTLPISTT